MGRRRSFAEDKIRFRTPDLEWRAAPPGACRTSSSLPPELRPPSAFRPAPRPSGAGSRGRSRPSAAGGARWTRSRLLRRPPLYRALLSTQLSEKSVSSGGCDLDACFTVREGAFCKHRRAAILCASLSEPASRAWVWRRGGQARELPVLWGLGSAPCAPSRAGLSARPILCKGHLSAMLVGLGDCPRWLLGLLG